MEENYSSIDLTTVKEEVANFACISESRDFIMSEEVPFNPLVIRKNLKETADALAILQKDMNLSFDGVKNVTYLFEKADKGYILDGHEIARINVFHNHCERIRKFFFGFDLDLSLRDYSDSLYLNKQIFAKISSYIDTDGDIKWNATKKLEELNLEISRLEESLRSKAANFISHFESSLQENNYYIRNDRITFLVRNSDKNKFNGFAFGTSASGQATYIEPAQFIELDNRKVNLIEDREEEIRRILQEMTYLVASVKDEYINNFESVMKLNVIFAKALYGYHHIGTIATLSTGEFVIKDAIHPLLDSKTAISNTYRLNDPYRGIVISGSNTGGKTVGLKTIGLSVVMAYLGIPIIASDARIPLFDNIYVDIDDNQSIMSSLSTFSAHISNIAKILKSATSKSLILIDELISGTDPKEAQAISLAIVERIKELGSRFVITTHFDDIKNYSYQDPNIMLSSVGFDMNTLKPTYHYYENSIGASNALEIAKRYFDDDALVARAKDFLALNRNKEDELMEELSNQIANTKTLEEKLNLQLVKVQEQNKTLEAKINDFEKEKLELKKAYSKKLSDEIEAFKAEAKKKLAEISSKEEVREVAKTLEEKLPEAAKIIIEEHEIAVGDHVRIKDNDNIGTVESIDGKKATVIIMGMKVKAKVADLEYVRTIAKTKAVAQKDNHRKYKRVEREINLVGERVEDGIARLEVYLDNAFASQMTTVKIIHGIGSGALRKACRQKLAKLSYVKSYRDGDYYDGGSAVTIVEFNNGPK